MTNSTRKKSVIDRKREKQFERGNEWKRKAADRTRKKLGKNAHAMSFRNHE